jgi:hypothetical protein
LGLCGYLVQAAGRSGLQRNQKSYSRRIDGINPTQVKNDIPSLLLSSRA